MGAMEVLVGILELVTMILIWVAVVQLAAIRRATESMDRRMKRAEKSAEKAPWTCPQCGASNPGTIFVCQNPDCKYSLT